MSVALAYTLCVLGGFFLGVSMVVLVVAFMVWKYGEDV